ncbi:MAG: thiosulfate oxidation carrier complex protein SoxZ [Alphaproteobacteria bacterium]|nr:thiosulfate oxidation carrier complex protein SoxZ [Alphaproteobacteria bacterium]TAD90860.1 MAG: thiosulfate oxidation carrier complex protein SoxZ [Alphaproteobacteria bacterium]
MSTPRVRIPSSARPGEVVEIRTLLEHPMESGINPDASGRRRPRTMLKRFEARADGAVVFAVDFGNGSATNPSVSFFYRVERTTRLELVWEPESGSAIRAEGMIRV